MLLAIETLLEFCNILLGAKIQVYSDHMNKTNPTTKYTLKQVQHWHQLIEEFKLEFIYLKGSTNNSADSLSRLNTVSELTAALHYLKGKDTEFKELSNAEQAQMLNSLADEEIANAAFLLSS